MSYDGIRLATTGGRDYRHAPSVSRALHRVHSTVGIAELIVGDADGADKLVREWGEQNDVPVSVFRADWAKHGRAAGPIRNGEMVAQRPDVLLAFPGGRGTADMVRQAIAAGIRVTEPASAFLTSPLRLSRPEPEHADG